MKVLITFPRSGSSWVKKYIDNHNSLYNSIVPLGDYFGDAIMKRDNRTCLQTIDWLNSERALSREYSIKYFTYHQPIINHTDWWNSFYSSSEIIYLERKNTWRMFLSYLMQEHSKWTKHNARSEEDVSSFSSIKPFMATKDSVEIWCNRYNTHKLINIPRIDSRLYYEDLTDEFLRDFFKIPQQKKVKNYIPYSTINYEDYILNIDEIREIYNTCIS